MPNIMLTYRCNLRCPYCFANEFVGESSEEISLEDFDAALEFLTRRAPVRVGLIGGEPTIHPHFDEMLRRAIDNPRIASITVFTNGIALGRYEDLIVHPKVSLLVNWNPRSQIGDKAFDRILATVDELVFRRGMKRRLNLGLNLHGEEFDYSYMLELLEHYDLDKVRISLTVPDFPKGCGTDVFEYFKGFKPLLLSMFADMDRIGVLPYYDCNRPPYCIWSDEEKRWLESYVARHGGADSSLVGTKSFCRPVIDILPTLEAVRCFGMSYYERVKIDNFVSLEELTAYFMRLIDRRAFRVHADQKCESCPLRRQWLCCQGCMGFKGNDIDRLRAEGK